MKERILNQALKRYKYIKMQETSMFVPMCTDDKKPKIVLKDPMVKIKTKRSPVKA